jgi:hypothetical protein
MRRSLLLKILCYRVYGFRTFILYTLIMQEAELINQSTAGMPRRRLHKKMYED